MSLYTAMSRADVDETVSGTKTFDGTLNVTGVFQIGGVPLTAGPGFIPLDLNSVREIATNDIQNLAAHGGVLASDSAPTLFRVAGASDKALRLTWAASNSAEIQFAPAPMPPDLDPASNVLVHLMAKMGGATDTPTIDVQAYEGEGDTEMGGATVALSATLSEVTVTLASANISGPPNFLNIVLVPGAHTTDVLYVYAAWIEYTRV